VAALKNKFYVLQILHPVKSRRHRAAIRRLRQLGRELVEKRLKEYGNGTETPRDMFSFILDYASE